MLQLQGKKNCSYVIDHIWCLIKLFSGVETLRALIKISLSLNESVVLHRIKTAKAWQTLTPTFTDPVISVSSHFAGNVTAVQFYWILTLLNNLWKIRLVLWVFFPGYCGLLWEFLLGPAHKACALFVVCLGPLSVSESPHRVCVHLHWCTGESWVFNGLGSSCAVRWHW